MSKNSIKEKFYDGKKYQTSAYLREKLFLSAERCRSILQGYEYNSELGENPKFYDEDIIKSIIDDYNNDEVKYKALEKRKIKQEKERAKAEKLSFENSESELVDVGEWSLVNHRVEKELVSTMLKNLFSALGLEFDIELFYKDVEKVEKYKLHVGNYGVVRPLEIIDAENRLLGNDGYLKKK